MAVSIPIVTEFDGKGLKKAMAEFQQLEGAGAKSAFALKKSNVASGCGVGWFGNRFRFGNKSSGRRSEGTRFVGATVAYERYGN